MTTKELLTRCDLFVATDEKIASCEPFLCSKEDLNDFFAHDASKYQKRLLGKTYVFCFKENPNVILAAFTLSNDSIRITNKMPETDRDSFLDKADLNQKRLKRYPSVLIGRLGINHEYESLGFGSAVMDFIKLLFLTNNRTGCRFLIVDAYNDEQTIHFYQKNGFEFLISEETREAKYMNIGQGQLPLRTRHMFFDLLQIKIAQ